MARNHHHHENGHDHHAKNTEANGHGHTQSKTQATFVGRVTSLPLVVDSVSTVQAYANKTSIGRFALTRANNTLSIVSSYQPKYVQSYYEAYLQPHVQRVDNLGCRSLDLLEKKFPAVNQPTAELVSAITAPPQKIISGVRGRLDATLTTVTTPAQSAARQANQHLLSVVDGVERVVDRILPPKSIKETLTIKDTNPALRAYHLLNNTSLRLSALLQEQVRQVPRSRDAIVSLASSSATVRSISANLQVIHETLRHSITVYSEAAKNRLPAGLTNRLHTLHGTVTRQLNQVYSFIKVRAEVPDWVKTRLKTVVDAANAQYEAAKREYSRSDISIYAKAQNVARGLQTQLLPVLESAQSQLQQYTTTARQRAQTELKLPLSYLGLNGTAKAQ